MLDRLFLSRLSSKGRKAYIFGQLGVGALLAIIIFSALGFDEGEGIFIVSILVTVVVWGLVCMQIWPKENEVIQEKTPESEIE
ncbi:MAG: hypothetical protein PQJ60_10440 [Spirochaetales bacterium]|nr:hypothetical protein [Spirochaetales bacterium]